MTRLEELNIVKNFLQQQKVFAQEFKLVDLLFAVITLESNVNARIYVLEE